MCQHRVFPGIGASISALSVMGLVLGSSSTIQRQHFWALFAFAAVIGWLSIDQRGWLTATLCFLGIEAAGPLD